MPITPAKLRFMPVVIALLRAVNVGGTGKIPMAELRTLFESLKYQDVRTFIQTGNVIFRTPEEDFAKLARKLENAIEKRFGFRTVVILRTPAELRDLISRNPFENREGILPSKLLVVLLESQPDVECCAKLNAIKMDPEELMISGRELFIYYPNGMARPSFSQSAFDRAMKIPGTGRNWNSVNKLLALAEELE